MTAVTVLDNLEINDPTKEVVYILATEAYTYTSKKFGTIRAATICANADCSTAITVSFSGAEATIDGTSISSMTATLVLYGRM